MFERHRNADGTYNGVTAMAELSGLTTAEIKWTFDRLKVLIVDEGMSIEKAKAIVKSEAPRRPWLTQ